MCTATTTSATAAAMIATSKGALRVRVPGTDANRICSGDGARDQHAFSRRHARQRRGGRRVDSQEPRARERVPGRERATRAHRTDDGDDESAPSLWKLSVLVPA